MSDVNPHSLKNKVHLIFPFGILIPQVQKVYEIIWNKKHSTQGHDGIFLGLYSPSRTPNCSSYIQNRQSKGL